MRYSASGSKIYGLILSILLLALASGCSLRPLPSPWVPGERYEGEPIPASFVGIREALDEVPFTRLLIIHGMGWHLSHDYDKELRDRLRDELQLTLVSCEGPFQILKPDDQENNYGGVARCTYRRPKDGALLLTYTLLWSPFTLPYKAGLLQYDWEPPVITHRAYFNRRLKEELIDKSFSDAVIFAGRLDRRMLYSVQQAICAVMTDQTDLSSPCVEQRALHQKGYVFAVTHSLGSMMLFEALGEMTHARESHLRQAFTQRLACVFMLANQLPLLSFSRRYSPPRDYQIDSSLRPLAEFIEDDRDRPLAVVAFTDPNDLLSYFLPENWRTLLFPEVGEKFYFVNFPVRNTRSFLGIFANPAPAHTGYWSNRQIIRAIVGGRPWDD